MDLDMHMVGKVMQFIGDNGDSSCEMVVAVDVTDTDGGEIEFGFDTGSPKRRTYLRVNIRDMRRVLKGLKS